eukprot:6158817-Pleurochrysis_carterae.AAC.2
MGKSDIFNEQVNNIEEFMLIVTVNGETLAQIDFEEAQSVESDTNSPTRCACIYPARNACREADRWGEGFVWPLEAKIRHRAVGSDSLQRSRVSGWWRTARATNASVPSRSAPPLRGFPVVEVVKLRGRWHRRTLHHVPLVRVALQLHTPKRARLGESFRNHKLWIHSHAHRPSQSDRCFTSTVVPTVMVLLSMMPDYFTR